MTLGNISEYVVGNATLASGRRLSEEELRKQAVEPVIGLLAGAYRLVNDRSIAPRGKIISARIGEENGDLVAYHTAAPYESSGRTIVLSDGTQLHEEVCNADSRPLTGFSSTKPYRICINAMDFPDQAALNAFVNDLMSKTQDVEITCSPREKQGLDLLVTFVVMKVAEDLRHEMTAEAVAATLQGLWSDWLGSLRRHATPATVIQGIGQNIAIATHEPAVEFHFKDSNAEMEHKAFHVQSLKELFLRACEAQEAAEAARVHFKWLAESWKLHYLQTSQGHQWLTGLARQERQCAEDSLKHLNPFG